MNKKTAVLCANLSSLVYRNFDEKLSKRLNKIFPYVMYFDKSGTQAIVAHDKERIVIIFRGTQPTQMADVSADLKTWPKRSEEVQGLVHTGFASALDYVWKDLEPFVDECVKRHDIKQVLFTGHSLGGALAVVAAARSKYVGEVYTYGQPRVGNRKYSKQVKSKVYRFVNNNDIVPRIPPPLVFRHQGTKYQIVDDRIVIPTSNWKAFWLSMEVRIKRIFKLSYFRSLVGDHDINAYHKILKSIKF